VSATAKFTCDGCGKQYAWKPELAGKKAKCKCGQVMNVPAEPPDDDGLLGLAPEPVSAQPPRRATVMPTAAVSAAAPHAATAHPSPHPPPPSSSQLASPGQESTSLEALAARHGIRRPVRYVETGSSLSPAKIAMIVVAAVVLLGGSIATMMVFSGKMKPKTPALGDDAEIQASIDDRNGMDLVQWLSSPNPRRMLIRMPKEQAIEWAGYMQKIGAVRVWAWGEVALIRVAVELPQDPDKRKAIFDYEQQYHDKPFPTKDVGQRYLYFAMN
jgi:hypothetical protein